ncbi:MAG: uroporphyrinogen decarboxylase family protein [Candidatus Izemoplasmatales bacterium]|jgi:uroporphyrinogen decarboxylase|nr:uroporphyrinogen decarboxylase family protein [Candidatus Izemoplasmatales bacterium]
MMLRPKNWIPNFHNMELILQKKAAPRPVFFDFIIGDEKEKMLVGELYRHDTELERVVTTIRAFDSAGFDHAPIIVRGLSFERNGEVHEGVSTKSLNSGSVISDWDSYHQYKWPEITDCDFSIIDHASEYLPKNVKFIPFSLDGILENTIGIVGFENLCYMVYDDSDLAEAIFQKVGERIEAYFTECLKKPSVGAILCNDDWGFNTQTMLPPDMLRKYVFPWYKKIVKKAHECGKYAILHSCGYFGDIIEDIIEDMKFDGRHSYEDNIVPVEKAYQSLNPRIAILGGIDVDFLARATIPKIIERTKNVLTMTKKSGGYALGSGNSIPDYIPNDHYKAFLTAALEMGDFTYE